MRARPVEMPFDDDKYMWHQFFDREQVIAQGDGRHVWRLKRKVALLICINCDTGTFSKAEIAINPQHGSPLSLKEM
jgi:hypothetical protein